MDTRGQAIMTVAASFSHNIQSTLLPNHPLYWSTCSHNIKVWTVVGVAASAQVELWAHRLSINNYTKTLKVYYSLSFRKESTFPF
jgi:hypothetical protein